jgi:hypothetical protein
MNIIYYKELIAHTILKAEQEATNIKEKKENINNS